MEATLSLFYYSRFSIYNSFTAMSYQVIARKWRPQTFEEVTGQETVTQTLRNALELIVFTTPICFRVPAESVKPRPLVCSLRR